MNAKDFAERLRVVADWFDAHPDVPAPYLSDFNAFVTTREEMAEIALKLGRAEKGYSDRWFYLRVQLDGVALDWNVPRDVACERRVVGTREIPETVVPARTEEIVEWDCHPIFKADPESATTPAGG